MPVSSENNCDAFITLPSKQSYRNSGLTSANYYITQAAQVKPTRSGS